jgi:hypothetical protein
VLQLAADTEIRLPSATDTCIMIFAPAWPTAEEKRKNVRQISIKMNENYTKVTNLGFHSALSH